MDNSGTGKDESFAPRPPEAMPPDRSARAEKSPLHGRLIAGSSTITGADADAGGTAAAETKVPLFEDEDDENESCGSSWLEDSDESAPEPMQGELPLDPNTGIGDRIADLEKNQALAKKKDGARAWLREQVKNVRLAERRKEAKTFLQRRAAQQRSKEKKEWEFRNDALKSVPDKSDWVMRDDQRKRYTIAFQAQAEKYIAKQKKKGKDVSDGGNVLSLNLPGKSVRKFLKQSKLPLDDLHKIWTLSDQDADGALSCEEFCVAFHLIVCAKRHMTLPSELPACLKIATNNYDKGNTDGDAAVKLQAAYRGYQSRRDVEGMAGMNAVDDTMDDNNPGDDDEAAIKLQAAYRGYQCRRDVEGMAGMDTADDTVDDNNPGDDDEAAIKLQAAYRGYQCRRDVEGMAGMDAVDDNNPGDDDEAAIKLQAAYRGYRTRSTSEDQKAPSNIGAERLSISARLEKQRKACQGIAASTDAEATQQVLEFHRRELEEQCRKNQVEETDAVMPRPSLSNQMELSAPYMDPQRVFEVMMDMKEEMRLMREEIVNLRALIQTRNSE